MMRITAFAASATIAIGLVLSTSACSGGSDPTPDTSAPTTSSEEADTEMSDNTDAVPVPFLDEKTGRTYILMVSESQLECLLEQSAQGVQDVEAVLIACDIDKSAVTE